MVAVRYLGVVVVAEHRVGLFARQKSASLWRHTEMSQLHQAESVLVEKVSASYGFSGARMDLRFSENYSSTIDASPYLSEK